MRKGFFRRKADAVLGVDINDASVRVVQLEASVSGYSVRAYGMQQLPAHAVVDSSVVDFDVVAQALSRALAQARTSLRHAAVAVAGPSVITRVLEMEAGLAEAEMVRRIHEEADQYIPYPLQDVAIDFQVQAPSARDPKRIDVLLVACLKEQVEAREAVLALAGLATRIVDVEAFALDRAGRQASGSITPGRRVDGAQWAVDAQGMGVACGLALRSFD
ncbi:type IV pilus assembly protein PilM [Pseudomonas yamanorum]|uniref:Type IV pilus assembly protein PilM n=1 Tax=Pseudomonas yamanorum TaxID=515393 RepID=A0A7Y8JN43_9PSED|nr:MULTISPECIES: type IV pilus assembly protein PilM [Pseudomonas]MCS3415705.1 type IV pilus assembly protein PilM [Pseudomonas sp. BIGb0558]MCS3434888.1 type IV pilus assembly protein PilM [Pseudomonas sp. BIGb0450]NVZ81816.1 type IV pilus assembly protein PilM [Pseudomonas yamanorum]NWD21815.1 type IV pilus assembly protein PilM [Pseudomonas yamanorum]NWE12079.1 type IV pilus assembly protein PilM [Pseudomonas yamanorum]